MYICIRLHIIYIYSYIVSYTHTHRITRTRTHIHTHTAIIRQPPLPCNALHSTFVCERESEYVNLYISLYMCDIYEKDRYHVCTYSCMYIHTCTQKHTHALFLTASLSHTNTQLYTEHAHSLSKQSTQSPVHTCTL